LSGRILTDYILSTELAPYHKSQLEKWLNLNGRFWLKTIDRSHLYEMAQQKRKLKGSSAP
jgi:hypothetical protein